MPCWWREAHYALLDVITIHWLLSIDKRLLTIVKTEFSTELKTKRICQMVKPIAQCIDDLLVEYENRDSVAVVSAPSSLQEATSKKQLDALINRVERLEFFLKKLS